MAPVVVDLGSGEVTQHLPIDRDQTYLGELDYYADATWAARYFEWSSSGGGEVLSLRRNAAAIPKIGWHLTSGNTLDHRYRLLAVETSMFDTFLAYTMAQHGAVMDGESTRDNFGRTANIRIGSRTLTVRWSRFESPPNFGHLEVSVNQYKLRAPLPQRAGLPGTHRQPCQRLQSRAGFRQAPATHPEGLGWTSHSRFFTTQHRRLPA